MANALPNSQDPATDATDMEEPTGDRAALLLTYIFPISIFVAFLWFIIMIVLVAGAK